VSYEDLNNIGMTYYKLGDFSKALKFYVEASGIHDLNGEDYANLYVNIALCHSYLGQFEKARIYLQRAQHQCRVPCSNENMMHFRFASGLNYYRSNLLDSAAICFASSLQHAELLNDQRMISDNIYFLTDIYLDRNEALRAKPLVHQAMRLAESDNAFPETRLHAYLRLSEFYFKTGRFRQAANFQGKYIELNDSVYSREYTVRLMAKEVEFAQQQNNARIRAQAEALQLNHEIVARQRNVNFLTSALAVIVLGCFVLLFRNYQQKKVANALLAKRVRERTTEIEMNRTS